MPSSSEIRYRRVSKGVNNFNLTPIDNTYEQKVRNVIEKYPDSDFYETIYEYNQDHFNKFNETKSVAGFTGLVTKRLVFDFDDKKNVDRAKKDAVELVSRLMMYGFNESAIRTYFSGNKGFHVEVHTNQEMTKNEVDNIITNLVDGLNTADKKILDENRLFRIPLSVNKTTGLYKIPITISELSDLSVDDIKKLADLKENSEEKFDKYGNMIAGYKTQESLPESIKLLKNLTKVEKKELDLNKALDSDQQPDLNSMPVFLSKPLGALLQGFFEEGERNEALMILATNLRKSGIPKDIAYNMLKSTLRNRAERLNLDGYDKKELYKTVIETVYNDKWRGGAYTDKHELVQKTVERYNLVVEDKPATFITTQQMIDDALNFLKNLDNNRVFTGIEELDEHVVITKGMLVGILGAPGSGKTTFSNNLVEYTSMNNNKVFYHSFDMTQDLLALKMIGKYCGYGIKKLKAIIESGQVDPALEQAKTQFNLNFSNVGFNFRSGFTVEQVRESIIQYKESVGQDLTLVVIDYLEKIHGPFSDPTANSAFVAARLADMAKELNVCIVLLLQPNKQTGDVSEPILSYIRIKGSSVIQQDCRVVLSLWRPGYDPEAANSDDSLDKYTSIAILKQNMGGLGKFDFMWNPFYGTIKSMSFAERNEFEKDIETLRLRKKAKDQSTDEMF